MRDIKFRGWTGEKMHFGWGCLTNESNKCLIVINEYDHYPDAVTLMQFTGLRDKAGKEIYEGDILQCSRGRKATIVQLRIGSAFMWLSEYQDWLNHAAIVIHEATADMQTAGFIEGDCEVIGNIHENPELLA